MNVVVPSTLVFSDLVKAAGEVGIEPKYVIEAALHHIFTASTDVQLNMVIATKQMMLEGDVRQEGMTPINSAELFMTGLPHQIQGLVQAMLQYDVIDGVRASANWQKLEDIILSHQPAEVQELARMQRAVKAAALAPVESDGGQTD